MFILYFFIYLFLEILFSYEFAKIFTPFGLFLEVIFSALVGIYIIRTLHISLAVELERVFRREISQEEFLQDGMFRIIGAFLLIIPGIFSDILGILFLMEPFARWVSKKVFKSKKDYHFHDKDDEIIDVEIVEIIEERKL